MSEPKFSVGQRVAVCTSCLSVVIPDTVVVDVMRIPAGSYVNPRIGKIKRYVMALWVYKVEGCADLVAEWCLRPLNDDDYTESTTDELERTA